MDEQLKLVNVVEEILFEKNNSLQKCYDARRGKEDHKPRFDQCFQSC